MKLSISSPGRGTQIVLDVEYNVESAFCEKAIGDIVDGEVISPEWRGFLLKITGGSDKQGFPMKKSIMKATRVRLLLKKGDKGFRCTREGLRRRKTVRGAIVSHEVRVLNLITVQEGEHVFEGFNDISIPLIKGPKRASKIRKMFNLPKDEMNLEPYVIGHNRVRKNGEVQVVKPKIQRLVTEEKKQEWKQKLAERIERQKKSKAKKDAYYAMLEQKGLNIATGKKKPASAQATSAA